MYKEKRILELKNKSQLMALSTVFGAYQLYLVGGCVRDMLLGREPKDYDLCTNATPDEIKTLVDRANDALGRDRYHIIETGIKHGTVTIQDCKTDMFFECTTYRVDGKYTDGRHPDEISFTPSLEEDLKRRDFTINSFAYDFVTEELIMLDESFKYDLGAGIIRCVGDSNKRFEEDALRMLRAIRFAAQLGFSIDKDTYQAIKDNCDRLQFVSKERIRDEITKILLSDNPQALEHLATTGLDFHVFMGGHLISAMIQCTQHNKYHYTDVFHHTTDVIKNSPRNFVCRWSAFFHDTGKVFDKTVDEEGWEHFYHHAEKSAKIAEDMMNYLKFSNEQKELIVKFVKWHDYPLSEVNNRKFKQQIVEIGEENFINFLKFKQADAEAHLLIAGTNLAVDAISICKNRFIKFITTREPMTIKALAINGNDLIEAGIKKGPSIGFILQQLLLKVLDDPELNTKEKLLELTKEINKDIIIVDKNKVITVEE